MKRFFLRVVVTAGLVLGSLPLWAEDPDLTKFTDPSGLVGRDALKRFLIQKRYPSFPMSEVMDCELTNPFYRGVLQEAALDFIKYNLDPHKATFTTNEVLTATSPKAFDLFGIRVREKWQDLKYYQIGDVGKEDPEYAKAKPATVAFSRDVKNQEEQWIIHGAVYREFSVGTTRLVPSVTLDKVDAKSSSKEVDSLVFRLAAVMDAPTIGSFYQDVRVAALYATDLKFRSSQIGAEFEWELLRNDIGLGAYKGFWQDSAWLYRVQLFIHAEGGGIHDAGIKPSLQEGAAFARLGPLVQLELKPIFLKKLSLTARWQDYEALSANTRSTRLFSAGASVSLDEKEHFTIELSYKNGRQALSTDRQEILELGLGLKF